MDKKSQTADMTDRKSDNCQAWTKESQTADKTDRKSDNCQAWTKESQTADMTDRKSTNATDKRQLDSQPLTDRKPDDARYRKKTGRQLTSHRQKTLQ
jgi:hypothetical protein